MASVSLVEQCPGLWLTELTLKEFDVRGAVVVGTERALVWDTLSHPHDMAPVQALLQDRPFSVVYSHADWDHIWGTAGLPAGAPIVAHDACRARFADDVPQTLAQMRADQPERWDEIVLRPPTITFADSMTLDLGGVTVTLDHLPGHTEDCIVAFIPEWGILLAGDTVETPLPIVNDGLALPGWIRRLQQWAEDERVVTVIPCHGEIGGRELIRRNIDYLAGLSDAAPVAAYGLSSFYDAGHQTNLARVRQAAYAIRAATPADGASVRHFIGEKWGSVRQVVHGELFEPDAFPGFLAERNGVIIGYASYRLHGETCQLLMLNSLEPGRHIGRRLIDAVADAARKAQCTRLSVVTTNDNLPALRLYQRYGFAIRIVRVDEIARSRLLKPEIPAAGIDGIPIRDEIELELILT